MYTHVCEYDLDAGYYLLVEGNPPEKPDIVKLYHKDVDKSIDIRTDDNDKGKTIAIGKISISQTDDITFSAILNEV